jgi:hypothetical protein
MSIENFKFWMELTHLLDLFGLKFNSIIKLKKSSEKLTKIAKKNCADKVRQQIISFNRVLQQNRQNIQILYWNRLSTQISQPKEIICWVLEFKILTTHSKKAKESNI